MSAARLNFPETSSMTKDNQPAGHTAGPWVWCDGRSLRHLRAGDNCFAQVSMPIRPDYDADARLIAASPDLLDAAVQIDQLMLVIESAVRNADPIYCSAVRDALKANRAALRRAQPEQSA